jgi:hypothetical protein
MSKTFGYSRNGDTINTGNNASIGQPDQVDTISLDRNTSPTMRRGGESQIFDNNGSSNKGSAGGVINKNGEYGSVTYGF